ncbi:hypothetical protein OC842_007845, partial [Tilletia horrida]
MAAPGEQVRGESVPQRPFTFHAPWRLPADGDAHSDADDISEYESAQGSEFAGGHPSRPSTPSPPPRPPPPNPLTRPRSPSASSDRVHKRRRHPAAPKTPTSSPRRTRTAAAAGSAPSPSRLGQSCPSPSCSNTAFPNLSDHIARVHTGPNRLSDTQLGGIGYVRCLRCQGCFRMKPDGSPWRHGSCPTSSARPAATPTSAVPTPTVDHSPASAGRTWTEAYLDLARLPTPRGLLPPHVVTEWVLLCERLATSYLANPTSEEALFHLLAAPKLALSPWRDASLPLLKSITAYPSIPAIVARPPPDRLHPAPQLSRQVRRLLRRGQLRRAAAELRGKSKVLAVDDEVLRKLRDKFPARLHPAF